MSCLLGLFPSTAKADDWRLGHAMMPLVVPRIGWGRNLASKPGQRACAGRATQAIVLAIPAAGERIAEIPTACGPSQLASSLRTDRKAYILCKIKARPVAQV